ncbi:uncharacterized protein [Procambarus clarkii]|uniref:uncharacterized protein isoform X2 n=1 Tax=Procambarus clarkii TaxID=6728 RepID=UPI0037439AA4
MSTVVNGLREEDSSQTNTHAHTQAHTHAHNYQGRTHRGHILPMLSFSASTPTDEENPLDTNPVLAIDTPIWEHPEDVIDSSLGTETPPGPQQHGDYNYNHHNTTHDDPDSETTPLIDVDPVDVVLVDGVRGEEENDGELDERTPLLGGAGGGDGVRGLGGLALPVNISRRTQTRETGAASCLVSADPELLDVANHFVMEILNRAQLEATKKLPATDKVTLVETEKLRPDERLMEVVRRFVSDIMTQAKAEAWDSMRQIQTNNNNVLSAKDEAAAAAVTPAGVGPGLAPAGSVQSERVNRRGGPWYVEMGRVFAVFLSRICPCRCPTKP